MHIVIDALPLTSSRSGVGHYTFELARALAEFTPDDDVELVAPLPILTTNAEGSRWPANLRISQPRAGIFGRRWFLLGLPRYLGKHHADVFHGTNYEVPIRKNCPTVLTIHDLSLMLHPETHLPQAVRRWRRRQRFMVRAATLIVTPTEAVRREVCEHLDVPGTDVVAVPEAAREVFRLIPYQETAPTRALLGIAGDFLLYVGTIEPRKNLPTLIHAYRQARAEIEGRLDLVVAGPKGWLVDEVFDQASDSSEEGRIIFTGYLGDEELRDLYSSCVAFIYPSLYEGFGLPPLEAMACGAPVVASRIPSITEVVGDAAMLFEPTDAAALLRCIRELIGNKVRRDNLRDLGFERARQYSWRSTARHMREVYLEAIDRESR